MLQPQITLAGGTSDTEVTGSVPLITQPSKSSAAPPLQLSYKFSHLSTTHIPPPPFVYFIRDKTCRYGKHTIAVDCQHPSKILCTRHCGQSFQWGNA